MTTYDANTQPPAGQYPALEAEVGITAGDVVGVAQVITALEAQWAAVADAIEAIRLAAKRDVGEAATTAAVADILAGLTWPSPA